MRSVSMLLLLLVWGLAVYAQSPSSFDEVNTHSYALYVKEDWKTLMSYGKKAIAEGTDFTLLRLRLGYAAFRQQNFSEAIKHYEAALKNDSYNPTARYYLWLSRRYLGQREIADVHAKYISKETMEAENISPLALTGAGFEASYKRTTHTRRGNALYARLEAGIRLGWRIHMQQAGVLFNQTIDEPFLEPFVAHSEKIDINQKEYYNKTTISLTKNWELKGAYHFLHTPFNNFSYNNHVGLVGLKYNSSYFDVQGDAIFYLLTDSAGKQYDVQIGLYPTGNLNLYSFSTVTLRQRSGKTMWNCKEVLGFKLLKSIWVEGNGTFGSFSNLMENDALYVYNAIDKNVLKAGATLYITCSPTLLLQLGYTFEQRELYHTSKTFYQHSTTAGLLWKL